MVQHTRVVYLFYVKDYVFCHVVTVVFVCRQMGQVGRLCVCKMGHYILQKCQGHQLFLCVIQHHVRGCRIDGIGIWLRCLFQRLFVISENQYLYAGGFRIGFEGTPVIAEDAGIVVGKGDSLVEVISIQSRNHTQTGQGLETVADTDDKFAVIHKFLQLIAQVEFDSVGENGSGTQVVAERESADEAEQVVLLKLVFSGQKIVEVDKFGIGTGEGTGCGGFAFAVETESGDNESFDFFVHGIKCDNLR